MAKHGSGRMLAPDVLRCEYLVNPLGIDEVRPRFSWEVRDTRRGAIQSGYEVAVASEESILRNGKGDVWNSGKVESSQSTQIEYSGPALEARKRYFWKVRTWDAEGMASPWSSTAWWEMGLLDRSDWSASWIGMRSETTPAPAVYTKKVFEAPKTPVSARIYATALGAYVLRLNGERVGDDILAPGWTDYRRRVMYRTFDVTSRVAKGENVVGAILGPGWYLGGLSWKKKTAIFGDPPARLLIQLEIEYEDGTRERVVSDGTWKCSEGPIRHSDIYDGEMYDARLEMPGWDCPGFDDTRWKSAEVFADPGISLNAQMDAPIRVTEEIRPVAVSEPAVGTYVFDLGQNIVGFVRLKVKGPAGTQVQLRHAEFLKPDGNIQTDNLRTAKATDVYILRGGAEETFVPHFTYHGFRYVEVTGYPGKPGLDAVTGLVAHSALPSAGEFASSSEMLNRLFKNVTWGFRGNIYSVPTDCPQRDERLGWLGDAQLFCRTSCYLMDTASFYAKFTRDISDAQSPEGAYTDVCPYPGTDILPRTGAPAWMDAGVIIPWTVYEVYGDKRLLERHFASMARYVDFVASANPDGIWRNLRGNDYGDWVPAGVETDKTMIATLYYFYSARLVSEAARVLGRKDDEKKYSELARRVRDAFNGAYLKNGHYENATQTINSMVIGMGVVPQEALKTVADDLVKDIESRGWHLSTGFIGTKYLLPALSEAGHDDVALRLLLARDCPSWGYMVENGATTIWERWNSDKMGPEMNSRNHFAFGCVAEWMFRYLAGIDLVPGTAGFEKVLIQPRFSEPGGELRHVKAAYESVRGRIACEWRHEKAGIALNVVLPANVEAVVKLSAGSIEDVTEGGKPLGRAEGVSGLKREGRTVTFVLGAGSYRFKVVRRG